ncbi:vacuolar protein sorting-associated protein 62 [Tanacetum coccineum]
MKRLELEIEQGVLGDLQFEGEWTQEEARLTKDFIRKLEAKFSIISDQKKELGDTLKQFRELFPDDDKFGDFHKRFAEMFKFGRGFGEDGKDGNEEVNAGETRAGKVEDAEGSGGQGDVEGSGRKSRCGQKIKKPILYSPASTQWAQFAGNCLSPEREAGSDQYCLAQCYLKDQCILMFSLVLVFCYSFGKAREHVSDWEHMRLGIDNVSGKLESIYLSQDTKWLQANEFEYINGRPVAYA